MQAISGTSDGRIFLGGSDGNVYEMEYDKPPSWWDTGPPTKCRRLKDHSSSAASRVIQSVVPTLVQNFVFPAPVWP